MVVAKLIGRSISTPEVRGSNTVMGKLECLFSVNCVENKEKEAGNGHSKKDSLVMGFNTARLKL